MTAPAATAPLLPPEALVSRSSREPFSSYTAMSASTRVSSKYWARDRLGGEAKVSGNSGKAAYRGEKG